MKYRVKMCSLDEAKAMESAPGNHPNSTFTGIQSSMHHTFGNIIEIDEVMLNNIDNNKSFRYEGWWYSYKWVTVLREVELRNLC